jgi:hypothetical protein
MEEPGVADQWHLIRAMHDVAFPSAEYYALAWSPDDRRIATAGRVNAEPSEPRQVCRCKCS